MADSPCKYMVKSTTTYNSKRENSTTALQTGIKEADGKLQY